MRERDSMRILLVAGARPNFMKIAPLQRALEREGGGIEPILVHTGQHYDRALSEVFFEELGMPEPRWNLGVGSGSHARQTAEILLRFERVVLEEKPAAVVVAGDVNSTVACSLTAAKMGVPVVHVEAGLRSFDRTMPEEINRIVTDALSDLLLASEPSALENLAREGVPEEKVRFVGNLMIDSLFAHLERARRSRILEELGLAEGGFGLVTLHRPSNVDDRETLGGLLEVLSELAAELPLVLPLHPRTRARIEAFGLAETVTRTRGLRAVEPLGYLDFLRLESAARLVLTDSGGVQEETTALGVPCVTLRDNTERPITVEQGTNRLAGNDPERVRSVVREVLRARPGSPPPPPPLWDGNAADRAAEEITAFLCAAEAR